MPNKNIKETSLEAYKRIVLSGKRETDQKRIILALEKIGRGNFEAIAKYLGEDDSVIWKRLGELVKMEILVETGETVMTKRKCKSMVYTLSNSAMPKTDAETKQTPYYQDISHKHGSDHILDHLCNNIYQGQLFD